MLVFTCFVFVLYREGLSGNFLLIGFFTVMIAVVGIFLKASNLINLDTIVIFISLYLVLYVFISHTKGLCEQLAIINQKISDYNKS